mgnify:CR=1 FL=1
MVNRIMAEEGQRVKVVDCSHGHGFPIGETVICTFASTQDTFGRFEYLDGSDFWGMEPEEYEIIE